MVVMMMIVDGWCMMVDGGWMDDVYWTNTLSWIFIVVHHWNNSIHVAPIGHVIMIPRQSIFALTTYLVEKQQISILQCLVWHGAWGLKH